MMMRRCIACSRGKVAQSSTLHWLQQGLLLLLLPLFYLL